MVAWKTQGLGSAAGRRALAHICWTAVVLQVVRCTVTRSEESWGLAAQGGHLLEVVEEHTGSPLLTKGEAVHGPSVEVQSRGTAHAAEQVPWAEAGESNRLAGRNVRVAAVQWVARSY